jgi:hypothetical protein
MASADTWVSHCCNNTDFSTHHVANAARKKTLKHAARRYARYGAHAHANDSYTQVSGAVRGLRNEAGMQLTVGTDVDFLDFAELIQLLVNLLEEVIEVLLSRRIIPRC